MSISVKIAESVAKMAAHSAGTLNDDVLQRVEELIGSSFVKTMETGCGKSTIFFSKSSQQHYCFALDDQGELNSSVDFVRKNELFEAEKCHFVFGPTQKTMPNFEFEEEFDVVFLDGPHGFPFPELEYFFVYPYIRNGGFLVIDDVHIPSIARFADILVEDEMFDLVETVLATAVFRRTEATTFSRYGDGWWQQRYNRLRVTPLRGDIHLSDGEVRNYFTSLNLDHRLMKGELSARLGQPPEGRVSDQKVITDEKETEPSARVGLFNRLRSALSG